MKRLYHESKAADLDCKRGLFPHLDEWLLTKRSVVINFQTE